MVCYLAAFLGICALVVAVAAYRAPTGRQIPGVGFVRDDDAPPLGEVGDPGALKLLHGRSNLT